MKQMYSNVYQGQFGNIRALMNKKEFPILSSYILRAMEKAGYDINNIGHCGLAEYCYTHFTSPIRRLCDLVVHMLIDYYEKNFLMKKK